MSNDELAEALAGLGNAGFRNLARRAGEPRNWTWLAREAKLHDRQNRFGYVVALARQLADRAKRPDAARRLREMERELESSRLVREDSFAGDALSNAERRWLRRQRPPAARHWNVLTDLTVEQLEHAL